MKIERGYSSFIGASSANGSGAARKFLVTLTHSAAIQQDGREQPVRIF